VPAGAAKLTPQSAFTEPYDFSSPSTEIASSLILSKLSKGMAREGSVWHTLGTAAGRRLGRPGSLLSCTPE
jgi:hypothetical protein